ncbi:MAG TPA: hypothetical protein VFZ36_01170, partial [Vicinamibacterales bacterium]
MLHWRRSEVHMYWTRLSPVQRGIAVAVAAAGLVIAGVAGMRDAPEAGDGAAAREAAAPSSGLRFVRWSHPSGLFSTDVPEGWTIDGAVGDAMELGQFRVNADSPDRRSHVSFAHNWLSFMEFQYGRYRPGAATVETLVLPAFLQEQRAAASRVVFRGANRSVSMPSEIGVPIPFDTGTVAFLLQRPDGGFSAGTAMGETMFIASPGTPGLWRLRVFAAAVAPADSQAQADARAAVTRMVDRLELSPQFLELWNRAFQQTQRQMREYGAEMDRVFSNYLASAARSASPP